MMPTLGDQKRELMFWEKVNALYDKMRGVTTVSLPFLGFGLIRRWYALLASLGVESSTALLPLPTISINSFTECAFLFVLIVLAKRYAPLYRRGIFVAGSAIALSFGSLLVLLGSFWEPVPTFIVLGEILVAAGFTTLFVVWLELYGCIEPTKIALAYAASFVVCSIVWETLQQFSAPSAATIVCLVPFASIALLIAGFRTIPATHVPKSDARQPSLRPLWRLIAWVAALSFAFGIADSVTSSIIQAPSYFGRLLPNLIILIGVMFFKSIFDLGVIYRITLPLVIVGFLNLLLATDNLDIAQFFLSAGSESFLALAFVIACSSAYRRRFSAAYICAIVFATHALFIRIGQSAGSAVHYVNLFDQGLEYAAIAVLGTLIFSASIVVFREKDFYLQWGAAGTSPKAATEESRLRDSIARFSSINKLSAREEGIALLMAQGKTNQEIASELFIAPGTVRTHVSRIYAKLDVHSREEFIEVLEKNSAV